MSRTGTSRADWTTIVEPTTPLTPGATPTPAMTNVESSALENAGTSSRTLRKKTLKL